MISNKCKEILFDYRWISMFSDYLLFGLNQIFLASFISLTVYVETLEKWRFYMYYEAQPLQYRCISS